MVHSNYRAIDKWVKWWLFAGVVMIFVQIIIGGITRLTGSGLSITKWEIVTGTVPPLTEEQWESEFNLYKSTPQYEKINRGISLSEFKYIYFWEYFHRLWARALGFVFILPLIWFLIRSKLNRPLLKRLVIIFLLAALVAAFGWIMVASGLVDRPWVNAYKLSIHLGLALLCYGFLLWTWALTQLTGLPLKKKNNIFVFVMILLCLVVFQILLGGLVSGMRAALVYPSWPDMNGSFVPDELLESTNWSIENFTNYDSGTFMPALVQFVHRNVGYLIGILSFIFGYCLWMNRQSREAKYFTFSFLFLVVVQIVLGIITLVTSIGTIPVLWGVLHQGVAILLLSVLLILTYKIELIRRMSTRA